MMGGATVRIRSMLLEKGISFYELEEKGQEESPDISMARVSMSRHGVSFQDLKRGTIYEELENQGKNKEDVDKEVKAMWELRKALYYNRKNHDDDDHAEDKEDEALLLAIKQALKEKENDGTGDAEGRGYSEEEALKDTEMHGDEWMTKSMKKAAKIEKKKKMLKIWLAECNAQYPLP